MRRLSISRLRMAGVLVLVASLSGSAFAQEPQKKPTGYPAGPAEARLIKEMSEEIGVGQETLDKLEKLVTEIRAEAEKLQSNTDEARIPVQVLLDQARPDEKALMAGVAVASGEARKTREHKVKASLRIRALLTDEQLEKFMGLRKKAMEKRRRGGRPKVRR